MIPRQWLVSCHRRRASAEAHQSVSNPPAIPGDGGECVGGPRSSPMGWNDSAGNRPALVLKVLNIFLALASLANQGRRLRSSIKLVSQTSARCNPQ